MALGCDRPLSHGGASRWRRRSVTVSMARTARDRETVTT
jgi:hypothetical protein